MIGVLAFGCSDGNTVTGPAPAPTVAIRTPTPALSATLIIVISCYYEKWVDVSASGVGGSGSLPQTVQTRFSGPDSPYAVAIASFYGLPITDAYGNGQTGVSAHSHYREDACIGYYGSYQHEFGYVALHAGENQLQIDLLGRCP